MSADAERGHETTDLRTRQRLANPLSRPTQPFHQQKR